MVFHDQLEREQVSAGRKGEMPLDSSPKTILIHLQDDNSVTKRLETGLSLARACRAHLSCLHVTPIEAYVAFDSFGGVFVMNDVIRKLDEQEEALKSKVQDQLDGEDVSWDYEQVTGNIVGRIASRAALADLVVTSRSARRDDFGGSGISLIGEMLHQSRTPLLIDGDNDSPCDPTGPALIAWDGSYEAANAVRSSVGLLKLSSSVRVLKVREEKDEMFPGTALLEYLSRHGIHAELQVEPSGDVDTDQDFISGLLMAEARSLGAAYIVMGGYNHSRIGQFLFGGVTRTMLNACPVPLVMAH